MLTIKNKYMSVVETKVSGAETQIAKAPINEPIITIDSRLKLLSKESQATLTLDKDKKLVHKTGTYYEGTVARVKTGRDIEFMKVQTSDREECETLARAYIVNRICRVFGYSELHGVKIPKIDFAINGTVTRFGVPPREDRQNEKEYMKANMAILDKQTNVLVKYLMESVENQTAITDYLHKNKK